MRLGRVLGWAIYLPIVVGLVIYFSEGANTDNGVPRDRALPLSIATIFYYHLLWLGNKALFRPGSDSNAALENQWTYTENGRRVHVRGDTVTVNKKKVLPQEEPEALYRRSNSRK